MRIAITADWHARGTDLPQLRAQLKALMAEIAKRDIDYLAVLGDVFERPQIGDNYASTGAIVQAVAEPIAWIASGGRSRVLMFPGNHDVAGAGSADALHVFDEIEGVHVMRGYERCKDTRGDLCALSWMWGFESTAEDVLRMQRLNDKDILLAHVEVLGARMGGSQCCEAHPGKWQISREFLDNLPITHVALGHFHTRQDLAGGRGGYVGALRQCNFGEEGNPTGFEIFDTKTGYTTWIELDAAPRYRTEIITAGSAAILPNPGEILRVRFAGAGVPNPRDVAAMESAGVQVEQEIPRQERIRRAEVPAGIADNPHGLIDLWAGVQNPPLKTEAGARLHEVFDQIHADKGKQTIEPILAPTGTDNGNATAPF